MKISIKSTSKILALFFITGSAWAGAVGRVTAVKGHTFTMNFGETKVLKVGDEIPSGSELISEEGSQISFNDFSDHSYHLAGSGQISLKEKNFELKRGYLWVQSFNSYTPGQVKTANSITTFQKSEFIVSFDNNSGRTQILAVNGPFDFSNLLERNLMRSIDTGNFSFIDKDYEHGMPRKGTMIGYQSYAKIVGLFDNVKPLDASVVAVIKGQAPAKKDVKEESLSREIASMDKVMSPSGELVSPQVAKKVSKKTGVIKAIKVAAPMVSKVDVKIYGLQTEMMETLTPALPEKARAPASVQAPVVEIQNQFESSLKQQEQVQPKHSSDVNKLIDELKSYQSDFTKEY